MLLIALLGWACLKLKVPVPWWCVLLLIAGAIALGFIYPVLWRRKHHPLLKRSAREAPNACPAPLTVGPVFCSVY
ncbi:hypothetical protein [Edaphobacter aggregans]|uniref:hypothetical protein n=1 Tax=Edaphobacter aggregans TaxID=570835 RepID=UPI0012F939EB|nr:hypothetical protein [Edaphobacter aggregans]